MSEFNWKPDDGMEWVEWRKIYMVWDLLNKELNDFGYPHVPSYPYYSIIEFVHLFRRWGWGVWVVLTAVQVFYLHFPSHSHSHTSSRLPSDFKLTSLNIYIRSNKDIIRWHNFQYKRWEMYWIKIKIDKERNRDLPNKEEKIFLHLVKLNTIL